MRMSLIGSIAKWYWSFYAHRKPRPLISHLVLTNICNYRCTFCYVNPDEQRYTMPLEQFKPLLQDLQALGTYYLYISGGEPLLVKNIEEYLVWAKKHVPYVHIVTNGSLLDQNMAKLLSRCGVNEVSLSLDALEKTHNLHRGSDKAFSKLLQAIENLKAHAPRIATTCATILGPWNIEEQEELHRLCASLGVRQRYQGFQEYPSVLQRQNGATLLTKEFLDQLQAFLATLSASDRDRYMSLQVQYYKHRLGMGELEHPIFSDPCLLPYYYVNILGSGEVCPCYGVKSDMYPGTGCIDPPKKFSLHESSLREIFNDPAYAHMAHDLKPCTECRNYFASCYIRPRLVFPVEKYLRYHLP